MSLSHNIASMTLSTSLLTDSLDRLAQSLSTAVSIMKGGLLEKKPRFPAKSTLVHVAKSTS